GPVLRQIAELSIKCQRRNALVVDAATDALFVQRMLQARPRETETLVIDEHGKDVPGVAFVAALRKQQALALFQQLKVAVRQLAATAIETLQLRELRDADARRNVGEVVLATRAQHVELALGVALDA